MEQYGIPVQPMENFFTFLSFAGWNPAVQKLYVQLTPPDNLLSSRGETRVANAVEMDHSALGHRPATSEAIDPVHAAVPHLALADVSPKLDELRWVKTAYEVERVRRSGRIGAAAVAEAIKGTRPGMYEYEIAAAAQYVNTRLGARCRRASWSTRNAIIAAMKPGVTIESLRDVAAAVYARHGYAKKFEATGRYIGHFVGISVHDVVDLVGAAASRKGGHDRGDGQRGRERDGGGAGGGGRRYRHPDRSEGPGSPSPTRATATGGRAGPSLRSCRSPVLVCGSDSAAGDQRERGWFPRPYCLAAISGTGYCGALRLQ